MSAITRSISRLLIMSCTAALLGCSTAPSATPPSPDAAVKTGDTAGASLHAVFDQAWENTMRNNPTWASSMGDMRYNDKWSDRSLDSIERQHNESKDVLKALAEVDYDQLSDDDKLNYALFKQSYQENVDEHQYRHFLIPLNQRGGIQSADGIVNRISFTTEKHYEDWITRMEGFDTYMEQTLALMRQGIVEGLIHPRVIMERLPSQIDAQITEATESGFYKPFKTPPDAIDAATFASLQERGESAIANVVVPAYRKMARFFADEYLPATRASVGIWDTPNGKTYYEQRARKYTTTDLTPDEIHDIGLREVKRIREDMQNIIDSLEFDGSFSDFLTFLRTDPQFYHDTPEALMQDYLATSKRIDPELVKLFSDLPRMPYGVKKIPDSIAPDTTTAYYSRPAADGSRAGFYFVNLYRPEVRPKYEIEVLTVHEAMPGHHLQIALAQELGELPMFRRFGGYTAFTEGWGLYSESLGDELGLYKDPYSKFGQHTYEMWRAVRLVVDTGIHYKGWSRERAIEFFKSNAAKAEYDIINEIDRYIAWPGQALAYKIGELKIKELRARSEQTLGIKFDIKAFHKVVLGSGAIPLQELEKKVDAWISSY